jgi:hypothetical protein
MMAPQLDVGKIDQRPRLGDFRLRLVRDRERFPHRRELPLRAIEELERCRFGHPRIHHRIRAARRLGDFHFGLISSAHRPASSQLHESWQSALDRR